MPASRDGGASLPSSGMSTLTFTITPLDRETADRLRAAATVMRVADDAGYPCRQCLRDADIGDELVLVAHDPFAGFGDESSPYRCTSPIYLHRDDCSDRRDGSAVPDQLARRGLSLRTYDAAAMMLDGRVVEGADLADALAEILALPGAERVHIHNAGAGCFAALATAVR